MTENNEPEYKNYEPVLINYVLYRTEKLGWQPKGWVIFNMAATNIGVCPKIEGAAWAEAPAGKYKSGDIFDPENP